MRSQYADYYNHDEDAPLYDQDVADETHPIRAGYTAALAWVIESVQIPLIAPIWRHI